MQSVYELVLVTVCLLHICSLLCACARIVSGEWIVAHLFTHTLTKARQRKQLSHNCIGTILGSHTPVCSVHILTLVSSNSSHVQLMSHSLNSWIFPPALFTKRILSAKFPCASGVCTYCILPNQTQLENLYNNNKRLFTSHCSFIIYNW